MAEPDGLLLRPIGVLRTPFTARAQCPRNGRQVQPPPECRAELFADFADGLHCLDGFSHLILLYWLDQIPPHASPMRLTPPFDGRPRGIFATRAPERPNPVGLSVVRFDGLAAPSVLKVRWLDCLDGTPLLDVKPYLPSTDSVPDAAMGWLQPHRTA